MYDFIVCLLYYVIGKTTKAPIDQDSKIKYLNFGENHSIQEYRKIMRLIDHGTQSEITEFIERIELREVKDEAEKAKKEEEAAIKVEIEHIVDILYNDYDLSVDVDNIPITQEGLYYLTKELETQRKARRENKRR